MFSMKMMKFFPSFLPNSDDFLSNFLDDFQ